MQPLLLASRVIDFLKEKDGGAFVYVEVCYFILEEKNTKAAWINGGDGKLVSTCH
jgi:hypothetical protein